MASPRRTSAVSDLDIARFGGPTVSAERDVLLGTAEVELVKPNPDRVMLIIANNGSTALNVSTLSPVTIARGLPVGSGNLLVMTAFDDGELVGRRLYAIAAQASTPVTIIEIERGHRF